MLRIRSHTPGRVGHHPQHQVEPHPHRTSGRTQYHEIACLQGLEDPNLETLLGAPDLQLRLCIIRKVVFFPSKHVMFNVTDFNLTYDAIIDIPTLRHQPYL
jgi:hypothetical protein